MHRPALRVPVVASLYYFAASAASKVIGVLTTPIFTRLLSTDGYGEYTLYISYLGVLSLVVTSLCSGAQGYRRLSEIGEKREEYLGAVFCATGVLCSVICILIFTFRGFLGINIGLAAVLSLQILCDGILAVCYMRARYEYKSRLIFVSTVTQSLVSSVLAVMLIREARLGAVGRIYALACASVIVCVPLLSRFSVAVRSVSAKSIASVIRDAIPLLPYAVSCALSLQADRFIINALLGTSALARYGVAHSVGAVLGVGVSAVCAAINPWVVRKLRANDIAPVNTVSGGAVALLCIAVICLCAVAPEAMRALAPIEYYEARAVILPIALSAVPSMLTSLSAVRLIQRGHGGAVSVAGVLSSLCAIALSLLLVPPFGYLGAALAQLIAHSVGAITSLALLYRETERQIVSVSRLCLGTLLCAAVSLLAFLFDRSLIIRGTIIAFAIIAALIKIRRVMPLIIEK